MLLFDLFIASIFNWSIFTAIVLYFQVFILVNLLAVHNNFLFDDRLLLLIRLSDHSFIYDINLILDAFFLPNLRLSCRLRLKQFRLLNGILIRIISIFLVLNNGPQNLLALFLQHRLWERNVTQTWLWNDFPTCRLNWCVFCQWLL